MDPVTLKQLGDLRLEALRLEAQRQRLARAARQRPVDTHGMPRTLRQRTGAMLVRTGFRLVGLGA